MIPFQLIQPVRNARKVNVSARPIENARYTVMVIIVYLVVLVSSVIMGAIALPTMVINFILGLVALQT